MTPPPAGGPVVPSQGTVGLGGAQLPVISAPAPYAPTPTPAPAHTPPVEYAPVITPQEHVSVEPPVQREPPSPSVFGDEPPVPYTPPMHTEPPSPGPIGPHGF
ncbi:hypothetical protein A4G26_26180 [Mycobacterium kansasii]|nr:hypothetical protein A4G26_26180 [Mycobacterium kansasii]